MPESESLKDSLVTKSRHQFRLSPNLSYILIGGLGGVGRAIATWMVERGARNLVFFSRSAGSSSQDQSFARELEIQGCNVVLKKGDATSMDDVKALIHDSPSPVGGILQLSMVIRVSRTSLYRLLGGKNKTNTNAHIGPIHTRHESQKLGGWHISQGCRHQESSSRIDWF